MDYLAEIMKPPVDYSKLTLPNVPSLPSKWETEAELYMEGLKAQCDELLATLKADQELQMICWHGHEKLQVIKISMPSNTVVAMHCIDEEGCIVRVTGHMNALTFAFRIHTIIPPAIHRPIGFDMPIPTNT